jgi:hypothetical protein
MRTFILLRHHDASGVSGTGTVAEGVEFSDCRCALRWVAPNAPASTGTYDSIEDVVRIHGHGGATSVVWTVEAMPHLSLVESSKALTPLVDQHVDAPFDLEIRRRVARPTN